MPSFPPTIGPARIRLHGHIVDDGDQPGFSKITHNGDAAKIHQWDDDGKRWRFFDSLSQAVFTQRADHLELVGVSSTLRTEVHLPVEDARVKIEIRVEACPSCG